ncbi:MAG: 30S ribosome-binding factor RbfA [Clostridia bacterium]|nr:30S ribosome-binding factor RbfA [Clostridia bacterium]
MGQIRTERVNEEMKKAVSAVIFEMKDPRIAAMTSITSVEVSPDLKYAKARVSVYDEDENARTSTVNALNHAAGFIAREAGKRVQIRRVPTFRFELDDSIAYSVHISKILSELNIKEEEQENES